ncbi:protein DBF4 homolog B [Stigmatopora nigra]
MLQHRKGEDQPELLGKLSPGEKKLKGKTFYLDNLRKRPATLLLEAIALLGGGIESFLHRDVSFVVTGNHERSEEKRFAGSKHKDELQRSVKGQESLLDSCKPRPGTSGPVACGSRGKALLEKAIRNNERLQASNVLVNARSWGVSIVHVDDILRYLKKLNSERVIGKPSRAERTSTKQRSSHVVKAVPLRSPYLKIEDCCRKYKPLHMQSMSFPSLYYSGRFSPFECPPPPRFEKTAQEGKKTSKVKSGSKEKSPTRSPWQPHKKGNSYCECCLQPFTNLEEHLQSEQHRTFVQESSNFSTLDCLIVQMLPIFDQNPFEQSEEAMNRLQDSLVNSLNCELETLSDGETEKEVQAFKRQPFTRLPTEESPLKTGNPPEEQIPVTNPVIIEPDIQESDSFIQPSDRSMPILDLAPQMNSRQPCRDSPQSTAVCIDPDLIPDVAWLNPSSSDSDWDCELLSRLDSTHKRPLSGRCDPPPDKVDQDFLHRPCTWMSDTSYESRLHTALQPTTPVVEPSTFSRTVVQIVEVLH